MTLPLEGIKVVEMTQVLAGPFAAMLLADQGADVIKIEPLDGDSARDLVPNYPDSNGLSLGFLTFNRNKRSIVLDMAHPKGRELTYSILRQADVLVIAMRTGTRQRRGLSYEDVSAINPKLIYASITGFGDLGPDSDQPGLDMVVQGRVGDIMARQFPNLPPPGDTNLYHFDMATAMLTAYSVVLALRDRDRTGQGQKVDLSLLHSALISQCIQMTRRVGSDDSYQIKRAVRVIHECSDGRWIFAAGSGARWPSFCRIMGAEQLAEDPAYDTIEKRRAKESELQDIFAPLFLKKPAAEWEAELKADGHFVSVLKYIPEVYDDPQVIANNMITEFEQPHFGKVKVVNTPFRMSASMDEPRFRRHAPTLAEHTDEILLELGKTPEEIEALKLEGVLF